MSPLRVELFDADTDKIIANILEIIETNRKAFAELNEEKRQTALAHPKVSEMVTNAIRNLKERGGSSLQAIKKHIAANHEVDMNRMTPFIKKYLKSSVASGVLIQTKGKGSSGSFKLSASGSKMKELSKATNTKKGGSPAKIKPTTKKADKTAHAARKVSKTTMQK